MHVSSSGFSLRELDQRLWSFPGACSDYVWEVGVSDWPILGSAQYLHVSPPDFAGGLCAWMKMLTFALNITSVTSNSIYNSSSTLQFRERLRNFRFTYPGYVWAVEIFDWPILGTVQYRQVTFPDFDLDLLAAWSKVFITSCMCICFVFHDELCFEIMMRDIWFRVIHLAGVPACRCSLCKYVCSALLCT